MDLRAKLIEQKRHNAKEMLRLRKENQKIREVLRYIAIDDPQPHDNMKTIQDVLLELLKEKSPFKLRDVIAQVRERYGRPDLPRTSISPHLSRLKLAGLCKSDGHYWYYTGEKQ